MGPSVVDTGETLVGIDDRDLPVALARLHRGLEVGTPVDVRVGERPLPPQLRRDLIEGGGFSRRRAPRSAASDSAPSTYWYLRREHSLADTVGQGMTLLLCGLNPSPYAADAGVGFGRPGNRFWPAALEAGIVTRDRSPLHTLEQHGIGMTDLVKRTTARADQVDDDEFRAGARRVRRLVEWLQPAAVCFVGLTGYRLAVDPKAVAGVQPRHFGGVATYVMPNPSGLNAHVGVPQLAAHLRAAADLATR